MLVLFFIHKRAGQRGGLHIRSLHLCVSLNVWPVHAIYRANRAIAVFSLCVCVFCCCCSKRCKGSIIPFRNGKELTSIVSSVFLDLSVVHIAFK